MVHSKKTFPTLIACLALGAFGAGCGGDDEQEPAGGGGASAPAEEPTGGGGGGKAVKVDTKDTKFNPKAVTVPKGGTVTWTNSDSFPHTVTKTGGPGAKFNGDLDAGATFEQTFDAAGKIDYVCTIHPGQSGTITVE